MNISVYKDSKKVMDKDIKINAKNKEHLLMLSISPFVLKSFFKLVALYPILIKDLPFVLSVQYQLFCLPAAAGA